MRSGATTARARRTCARRWSTTAPCSPSCSSPSTPTRKRRDPTGSRRSSDGSQADTEHARARRRRRAGRGDDAHRRRAGGGRGTRGRRALPARGERAVPEPLGGDPDRLRGRSAADGRAGRPARGPGHAAPRGGLRGGAREPRATVGTRRGRVDGGPAARAAALPQLLPAPAGGVGGGHRALAAIIAAVATRAVLFDLDETLIPEDGPLEHAYLAVVRELHGPDAGAQEVAALRSDLRAVWAREAPAPDYRARVNVSASDGLIATFAGDGAERAAIRAFLPRFQAAAFGGADGLLERWRRVRWESQTVYPGAHVVLRTLRGRFRLGLVSNGASDLQRTKLARTGLADCFDAVVVSSDVGAGKPDPHVFLAALDA